MSREPEPELVTYLCCFEERRRSCGAFPFTDLLERGFPFISWRSRKILLAAPHTQLRSLCRQAAVG